VPAVERDVLHRLLVDDVAYRHGRAFDHRSFSGNLQHFVEGIRDGHATAVLAASIFHFGECTIRQAKDYMAGAGLPMRLDP